MECAVHVQVFEIENIPNRLWEVLLLLLLTLSLLLRMLRSWILRLRRLCFYEAYIPQDTVLLLVGQIHGSHVELSRPTCLLVPLCPKPGQEYYLPLPKGHGAIPIGTKPTNMAVRMTALPTCAIAHCVVLAMFKVALLSTTHAETIIVSGTHGCHVSVHRLEIIKIPRWWAIRRALRVLRGIGLVT